jgi:hypothetical protein
MKNFLTHLTLLSTLSANIACVADAPKRQGPTRPGVDNAPSQGVTSGGERRGGGGNEEPTCEDRGLVTSARGTCESTKPSCDSQGKTTDANGECVDKPAGDKSSAPATAGDKSTAPATAGDKSTAPATAGKSDAKSLTLTAQQSTFLISLDAAKPNCFVAQGETITVDSAAAKEYAANPAQISTKILESNTNCPVGSWNHFKSHFK